MDTLHDGLTQRSLLSTSPGHTKFTIHTVHGEKQVDLTKPEINLKECKIGAEGAKALAAALPGTEVINLQLLYNGIGDEGAAAIAAVLPSCALTDVYLWCENTRAPLHLRAHCMIAAKEQLHRR